MSSIRPLVTITVLVVVGVVLYVKINEGTPRPAPGANDTWNAPVDGVPPLATSSVAPTTSDGAAPAWPATPVAPAIPIATVDVAPVEAATPPATAVAPATATAEAPTTPIASAIEKVPAVPAVPPLPEISATTQVGASTDPTAASPTSLPTNVPEARYPDQAPATDPTAPPSATTGTPAVDAPPIATAPSSAQEAATTPEQMNAATASASGIPTTPTPLDSNPLRPSTDATPLDRYGIGAATTTPTDAAPTAAPIATPTTATPPTATSVPITPVEQSFAESWPAIQAMLDRGELTAAHQALSKWYGDPSLTPTDAERVDTLLGQLAGTVVYSTEHRLAPAHVVKQGETLETIAKEYNVPWQLLAKINGVAVADQVRPGQELKVVRGPFSAVVDLSRKQLTLLVDDRYAGKFPVTVTPGQTIYDGEWVVGKKSNPQAPGRALLLQGSAATPGAAAPMMIIASDSLPTGAADGTVIKVAARDAEELSDILSVGSRVVTRR